MNGIESFLYEISKFFLAPVLVLLCAMFVYALFCMGMLLFDVALRTFRGQGRQPIHQFLRSRPTASQDDLELHVLKQIELQRIVSRIAPMLGLVATMIPMGPALIAVSAGNAQGMAQDLVVAFAAVIVALLSAAITYVVQLVRKRWLLEELGQVLDRRTDMQNAADTETVHTLGAAHA
ncbi:MAG: MotA/TolQ/ExbB proton channel family protein [Burkholderiales bacterium]|jgi:biopolymer transport protein ExbB/TolQ|uniref:MotA/TolQ/ExbB proton channel family protein n=1 Tax=Limnohabitans sp. TaxID=1907725 RepID=UPI0037BF8847